ncbi:uncharacterized protein [Rutidosis leptorrhynchoides]|uniref:uncharacterized protein n=1 Tax=Rutidosis leptorrhynchoides TaxID=125765 RepID=UPI003A98DD7B
MALVLKKLVSRSFTSVVVPYLRPPPNHHPRHFFSQVRSILKEKSRHYVFDMPTKIAPEFKKIVFNDRIPHTLRVTSRVEGVEARFLSGGDVDLTLGSSMKFSLEMPGIEKITETPENLYVFIDMGLHKIWVRNDLDAYWSTTKLVDCAGLKNVLSIAGYVQKLDIRRHYTAVVPLPPNIKVIKPTDYYEVFFSRPENGGVVYIIPKQQEITPSN